MEHSVVLKKFFNLERMEEYVRIKRFDLFQDHIDRCIRERSFDDDRFLYKEFTCCAVNKYKQGSMYLMETVGTIT